jgi:hypothetical protein
MFGTHSTYYIPRFGELNVCVCFYFSFLKHVFFINTFVTKTIHLWYFNMFDINGPQFIHHPLFTIHNLWDLLDIFSNHPSLRFDEFILLVC